MQKSASGVKARIINPIGGQPQHCKFGGGVSSRLVGEVSEHHRKNEGDDDGSEEKSAKTGWYKLLPGLGPQGVCRNWIEGGRGRTKVFQASGAAEGGQQ